MNTQKITIQAEILADIQKVWDYYTKPEHIIHWNFAIDTWHCPHASNDLQMGGKYVARMEAKDGSFGFDYEAVYNEIIPYKKITYTLGDNRVVKIVFNESNGQTQVIITFDPENINPPELQQQGWQSILNNFKKYAETH
jgi:uncharacterized protein YndB with AHSA1/START domain